MTFDIWCGTVPTEAQCRAIHGLMSRTMKKFGKPFFAHTIIVKGPHADRAFAALSHIGCNVSMIGPKHRVKHAVVISGPAPREFMQNRKQVLVCPSS